jgi:hypothetical protein
MLFLPTQKDYDDFYYKRKLVKLRQTQMYDFENFKRGRENKNSIADVALLRFCE